MFQAIWKDIESWSTRKVLIVLIVTAVASILISIIAHIFSGSLNFWEWLDSAAQNFSTEMMGAIVTFGMFELILGSQKAKREKAEREAKEQQQKAELQAKERFEKAQLIEELQKRLVREARSQSNETAKAAVEYLRAEGWLTLTDSIPLLKEANLENAKLQGVDLHEANLQAANLREANLQAADLEKANLQKTDLWQANLQQAELGEVNLQQADLKQANLQQADLGEVNLQQANLWRANLQRANLEQANLRWATVVDAEFDEKTVLPDAVFNYGEGKYDKYWTPETDMRRYIDPEHPDFWQPDYLKPDFNEDDKPWWAKKQAKING